MREIVFDTETTGFEPGDGHRIVEIGCVELMDHFPTGRTLQFYLNPERDIPIESQRVHGLSAEFLADKALFAHVVEEFLEFIADSPLVIHNASFDLNSSMPNSTASAARPFPMPGRWTPSRSPSARFPARAIRWTSCASASAWT
jgi:DNA polymerase-3 subunit epsilon